MTVKRCRYRNKKQPQAHQIQITIYFLIVLISDRYVSHTALTEICRKDIRHPRPGCAPSLSVIGSIPGEDGAHPFRPSGMPPSEGCGGAGGKRLHARGIIIFVLCGKVVFLHIGKDLDLS